MNKLFAVAIAIFVLINIDASAQYSKLRNSKAAQVGVGFTDVGMLVNYYYVRTFDQKIKGCFGGGFVIGKVADIKYRSLFIDGAASFSLYDNRLFSLNALAGISAVADVTSEFETAVDAKRFSANYGVLGGGEAEFIATKRLSFILAGTQRYYIKKDYGNLRYHLFAAIRLTL